MKLAKLILIFSLLAHSTFVFADSKTFYCLNVLYQSIFKPLEYVVSQRFSAPVDVNVWMNQIIANLQHPVGTPVALSPEASAAVRKNISWMRANLGARLVSTPLKAISIKKAFAKLKNVEQQLDSGKSLNWKDYLDAGVEFTSAMGRIHWIPDGGLTNNGALTRNVIDSYVQDAADIYPYVIHVPVSEDVNIRDLNDMSPYPIEPVQLQRYRKNIEGQLYYPLAFHGHDYNHASAQLKAFRKKIDQLKQGLITPKEYIDYINDRVAFYNAFRKFTDAQTPRQQQVLDHIWYFINHEGAGGNYDFKLRGEISPEMLLQVLNLSYGLPKDGVSWLSKQMQDELPGRETEIDAALIDLREFANRYQPSN